MKKFTPIFFLLILVLSSCNQSFYNTRHHAHRDYVKMGPPQKNEDPKVANEENKTVEVNAPLQISTPEIVLLGSKKPTSNFHSPKPTYRDNKVVKKPESITKPVLVEKKHRQKHKTKGNKDVKASAVLNIISLCLGIVGIVTFFVTGIVLLFALLESALLITGMTMLWFCLVVALLAIIFGVLGLSLKHPSQGLGIAGVIMGGIILFSILLILIIMAVV